MDNILKLILSLLLFLFLSCGEDSPTEPENNEPDATATIGADGGTAQYENISVVVPSGSFDANTELGFSSEQTDVSISGTAVSEQYSLTGVPESFSQPIQVTLQSTASTTGEVYIAAGYTCAVKSLGAESKVFEYFEAELVDGGNSIRATIPPTAGLGKFTSRSNVDGSFSISIAAIGGHSSYTTDAGHFKIQFPTSVANDVPQLGTYLEEAYEKVSAMGFSYADRSRWPVVVKVKKLDASVDGYFAASMWGDNYGTLEFNMDKLGDLENLRSTAGHEFLHLIQDLYDPRTPFSRVKFSPTQLWLDEASAVWVEEKFSSQSNYTSNVRAGNVMAPFEGVHKEGSSAPGHGYGMSGMIKYLADKFGDNVVSSMYSEIYDGTHPVYAVTNSISEATSTWFPDFMKKYTLGQIYDDVQTAELVSHTSTKRVTISSLEESDEDFLVASPKLSGHFYDVRLTFEDSDEENANIAFTSSDNNIIVFSFKGSDIKYEKWGYGSVTMSDLMSYKKNGRHLLALVVNTDYGSPHDGTSDVYMKIEVEPVAGQTFPYTKLAVMFYGIELNFQDQDGNLEWRSRNLGNYIACEGGFDANGNFSGTWSGDEGSGSATASVNLTTGELTLTMTYTGDYSDWGEMDYATLQIVNMEPWYMSDTELEYLDYDCDKIGSVAYREEFDTGDFIEAIGWRCNDNSEVRVKFYLE